MWILNRAGRIPFVISGQGHEGAQVGIAWAFQRGHDWIAPFYRSIATCLTFGMSAARHHDRAVRDGQRPLVGRAPDAGPLRLARAQPRVGLVAGRDPAAARGRHRPGGQDPQDRPGRDDLMGEGSSNQGDVHEGLNFAAIHKLPFVFVVENNGYAISVPAAMQVAGRRRRRPGRRLRHPGRRRRRQRRAGLLSRPHGTRSRGPAPATGPTLIEAKVTRLTGHSSDDQQTKYRSEEELAASGRATRCRSSARSSARPGCSTDEIEARLAAEITAAVEDATDYAEAQPDPDPGDRDALRLRRGRRPGRGAG